MAGETHPSTVSCTWATLWGPPPALSTKPCVDAARSTVRSTTARPAVEGLAAVSCHLGANARRMGGGLRGTRQRQAAACDHGGGSRQQKGGGVELERRHSAADVNTAAQPASSKADCMERAALPSCSSRSHGCSARQKLPTLQLEQIAGLVAG